MTNQNGVIFSTDALLGAAALMMLIAAVATFTPASETESTHATTRQIQIMAQTESLYLGQGVASGTNTPNPPLNPPQSENYYCYYIPHYDSQTSTPTQFKNCEATK